MSFWVFIFVQTIVFVALVLPLWLLLHYVTLWKTQRAAGSMNEGDVADLAQAAKRLEARIDALERVVDGDSLSGSRDK